MSLPSCLTPLTGNKSLEKTIDAKCPNKPAFGGNKEADLNSGANCSQRDNN